MSNPNTAVFPSALPTDSTLMVATNDAYTTLSNTMDNSQTTGIVVANSFAVPCIILIDSELIYVGSKVSNTYADATRGFGGTTPVGHIIGSSVYGFIEAYHHNQITSEIKAIAEELGVNLGNVIKTDQAITDGDLTGTYPHPTVSQVGGVSAATIANIGAWYTGGLPITSVRTYTVDYLDADFKVADTDVDIILATLAARAKIVGITIKHSVAWRGTGASSMTVSIGDGSGSCDQYVSAFDIYQAVGNTTFSDTALFKSTTMASSNIVARLICDTDVGDETVSISAATNASPVEFTSTAHGLVNGNTVTISGATGTWVSVNGTFVATKTGDDTFTIPIDSTLFGALAGTLIFDATFLTAGSVDISVYTLQLP